MKTNILILATAILLTSACGQKLENASEAVDNISELDEKSTIQSQLAAAPANDLYSDGKTKLIKNANYRFEVENVKRSTEAITASIKKFPAYISSSSLHLENPILENKITIRVQNEFFNNLLTEIDAQALFVNYRDVTTQDVSKEFVDLESRLKTKREVEMRYIEILRSKAGTIEELLNAEEQIADLHEEIEATISRINYLKEQVSYSTINLEFYQTITQELKASTDVPTGNNFKDGIIAGWKGVLNVLVALTYIWPLIIIGAGAFYFVRYRQTKARGAKAL